MTLDELFETVKKRASSKPDGADRKIDVKGPENARKNLAKKRKRLRLRNDPIALTSEADVIFT